MKDPAILQAALSHAAVHMDVVNRREPSKLSILHKKLAIRMINQRLDSKPFVVDNEFIEAVAIIASNSVSVDSTSTLTLLIMILRRILQVIWQNPQIHMDALQELVRLKGGKDNLGPETSLHTLLSW